MKNLLLLGISFLALLTGCTTEVSEESTNVDQQSAAQTVTTNAATTEETSQKHSEETNNEADLAPVSEEELENSEAVSSLENYEELSSQDYFNPEDFQAHLITDNPGTRVFIFHEGSEQAYKTVFIKDDKRLKVIDLVNNELLMNDII